MAQKRLSMRKTREILRLRFGCGLSYRAIARSCSASASSVYECVQRAEAAGLGCWPLPNGLDDAQLNRRLYADVPGAEHPPVCERPLPDWSYIHAELSRKGVTKRLLWLEYREAHPDGYGYSRFCELASSTPFGPGICIPPCAWSTRAANGVSSTTPATPLR